MLKSIRMQNFFSFKDTKIELNPKENVLVGINASGKSNLLKAIQFLKEGVSGIGLKKLINDTWGGFDAVCFCGDKGESGDSFTLEYEFYGSVLKKADFIFCYTVTIARIPAYNNYYVATEILKENIYGTQFVFLEGGEGKFWKHRHEDFWGNDELFSFDSQELALFQFKFNPFIVGACNFHIQNLFREAINEIMVYYYFNTTPNSSIRKPMKPMGEDRLLPDGSNLPQMLNTIKINHRKQYQKMIETLNDINEKFKGFEFDIKGQNIELMLEESGLGRLLHVSHISDGTLVFLCLLSIIFNPKRGKLVCIDEPETGLHPDMIYGLIGAIMEVSEDTQFIIATHSENVLNRFRLENVRVVEKDENNSTIVNSFTEEDFKGWYDDFFPGKMWRAGDIGGNRW